MSNQANHPHHYNAGSLEVIKAIDAWQLGFSLGNVVKYVARAEHKRNAVSDLTKAAWYLVHEIGLRAGVDVEDIKKAIGAIPIPPSTKEIAYADKVIAVADPDGIRDAAADPVKSPLPLPHHTTPDWHKDLVFGHKDSGHHWVRWTDPDTGLYWWLDPNEDSVHRWVGEPDQKRCLEFPNHGAAYRASFTAPDPRNVINRRPLVTPRMTVIDLHE